MIFRLSPHAEWQLARRRIPLELLEQVLHRPEQAIAESGGKRILQSRLAFPDGKVLLLRAVVVEDKDPPVVVTVYRTSKIAKYWRPR